MSKQYQKQKAKWIEQGKQAEQNRIIEIIKKYENEFFWCDKIKRDLIKEIKQGENQTEPPRISKEDEKEIIRQYLTANKVIPLKEVLKEIDKWLDNIIKHDFMKELHVNDVREDFIEDYLSADVEELKAQLEKLK